MNRDRNKKGFTLVELMTSVAIVAIVAAVAINSFRASRAKARWAEAATCLGVLAIKMENYRSNRGLYPSDAAQEDFVSVWDSLNAEEACGDYYNVTVNIFENNTRYVMTACDTVKPIWSPSIRDVWVLTDQDTQLHHYHDAIDDLNWEKKGVIMETDYHDQVAACD